MFHCSTSIPYFQVEPVCGQNQPTQYIRDIPVLNFTILSILIEMIIAHPRSGHFNLTKEVKGHWTDAQCRHHVVRDLLSCDFSARVVSRYRRADNLLVFLR